jgi:hypothetical protein
LMVAARDMASRFSSLICRATRASSASNAQTLAALTGSQADGHAPSTMLSSMVIAVAVAVGRLARARKAGERGGGGACERQKTGKLKRNTEFRLKTSV